MSEILKVISLCIACVALGINICTLINMHNMNKKR